MASATWMTDLTGAVAQIPADQVDTWANRGWAPTDEPTGVQQVWTRHTGHGGHAKFAAAALEDWHARGWELSAPPEPGDLTRDPLPAEPAAQTSNRAASARNREEHRA